MLDVTETWHRTTQLIIWSKVIRNNTIDVISDTYFFKKADTCSFPIQTPKVSLHKTIVEHGHQLVMSMTGVDSNEMTCSLSVTRDCKIGCQNDVNNIDSSERLNELVAEYMAWCRLPVDRSSSENAVEREFYDAGFTILTNFPVKKTKRMRRSTPILRSKRAVESPKMFAQSPFTKPRRTWEWSSYTFTGPKKELRFNAPKTPGKWRAHVLCVSPRGIRISPAVNFTVEKLLHIETSLPVKFKVGKKYNIAISVVYNGKRTSSVKFQVKASKNTKVDLQKHDHFRWSKPKHQILKVVVTPLQIGTMKLQLTANATSGKEHLFQDRRHYTIPIEPEGITRHESIEYISCGKNSSFEISIPPTKLTSRKIVDGSEKMSVLLSGNIIGNSLKSLDSLIREPEGLSENNAAILAVNLKIFQYYKAIGYKSQNVLLKLQNFIKAGFQRQLTFRNSKGYFFFKNRADPPSTWFTTFIFSTFNSGKNEIPVKSRIIDFALDFILSKQNKGGCFEESNSVNMFSLAGGFHRREDQRQLLTAFVMYNLQTVFDRGNFTTKIKPVLPAAFQCLEKLTRSPDLLKTHTLAVMSRALAAFNNSHPFTKAVWGALQKREKRRNEERYWVTDDQNSIDWNDRLASDVETTSHAVIAKWSMQTKNFMVEVVPVFRWLIRQGNSLKWFTYIDETEALKALLLPAKFSHSIHPFNPELQVKLYDGLVEKFALNQTFDTETRDLVFDRMMPAKITKLQCRRTGKGCVLIYIYKYFNVV